MVLTTISSAGGGSVAAAVTFTSRQSAADSHDASPCTDWRITLYLQPDGSSYLIGRPPASYHASSSAC